MFRTKHGRAFIECPFKGTMYYEWQILCVVFQFQHADSWDGTPTKKPLWKRVHIWIDKAWGGQYAND